MMRILALQTTVPACRLCGAYRSSTSRKLACVPCGPRCLYAPPFSLVTLAVQNSALTLIMHYSRISIPPSRAYSAATAVLMNEILKGLISLTIAFTRIDPTIYTHDLAQAPYHPLVSRWDPRSLSCRLRKLFKDIFSPDCWKLSIPAILYGKSSSIYCSFLLDGAFSYPK